MRISANGCDRSDCPVSAREALCHGFRATYKMLAIALSKQRRGTMFRLGALGFASLIATTAAVLAQTPVERGQYLVNSILACGNCHTPKTANGKPIAEKELSGGLVFTTPAFDATASNITPDQETGVGAWSDAEIKRALTDGISAGLQGCPWRRSCR